MTIETSSPLTGSDLPTQPAAIDLTRLIASVSLIGLIVLCVSWELWLAPLRTGGTLLALKALPLCFPLTGILKNRLYTYRWVSLMIWLYFIEGVVRGYSDTAPSQYWAWLEIALCLCLFVSCAVHVRARLAYGRALHAAGITPQS
jgi:uncharacterized membrane protein